MPWEVIIVDNCCTDGSAEFAMEAWSKHAPAPLRVVREQTPGKLHAFARGIAESRYDIVGIVDDDNWVCPDWVDQAANVMAGDSRIGICIGASEAAFEGAPPAWFSKFAPAYAVEKISEQGGDITWTRGGIWGAGSAIRKKAWQQLLQSGYKPALLGRTGSNLAAGEDAELGRAMRMAGWKLYYEPRMYFRHFMPASRLDWSHLRRLKRGFGAATVGLDGYAFATKRYKSRARKWIKELCLTQILLTIGDLARYAPFVCSSRKRAVEGSESAIMAEYLIGRFEALWQARGSYAGRLREIRNAPWRAVQSAPEHPAK